MRTVGVEYDADRDVYDLDGRIPTELEALRQRLQQAVWLRAGEWFLNRRRGLNRDLIIGHQINAELAAQALNDVIRTEGRSEVTGLRDTFYEVDRADRRLRYRVVVDTIYGEMAMEGTA